MRFTQCHSKPTSVLAMALFGIGLTVGCTPSAGNDGSGGSGSGSGGNGNGSGGSGSGSGGNKGSGGSQVSSGGTTGTGGHTTGTGGSSTGSGGSVTGTGGSGTSTGGSGTGTGGSGTSTGGSGTSTGGSGTSTGGAGTSTGGSGTSTGGSGTSTGGSGAGTGGSAGSSGGTPPGWWTSGTFHGCPWTGIDVLAGSATKNTPQDFVTKTDASKPYCVSGTVTADPGYNGVALLGFNLQEAGTSSATQCAYKPADPTAVGPPEVTLTGTGIAVNFTKSVGSVLRIQLQGANGGMNNATGIADRWCYTITDVQGPVFAPFNKFNTTCWNQQGTNFDPAKNKVDAIVFGVPGETIPTPFSYCIGGFAMGSDVSAAPPYTPSPYPVVAGTLGGSGSTDLDFQRIKVAAAGAGGKQYIVQNNNWGTPASTDQTIMYSGNSFTIMSTTGNVTGAGVPAAFPSIFVGGNGDTQSVNDPPKGSYTTHPGDNLPKAVSAMASAMTTAAYNRNSGDYNAAYDIWMAAPPAPTSANMYSDALDGFVMVWLYQPSGRSPIGQKQSAQANIGGNTYDVWVGPRNSGSNPNRPVVSYVANPSVTSRTFDLKPILMDASNHGIPSNWFVTDIFFGFEIWTGSSASGLSVTNFSVDVK